MPLPAKHVPVNPWETVCSDWKKRNVFDWEDVPDCEVGQVSINSANYCRPLSTDESKYDG